MKQAKWVIFGADAPGLEALVQACIRLDMQPVLAGTHFAQVQTLAYRYQLEYCICDLFDSAQLDKTLADSRVVLNALSPYPLSSQILVDACLRQHCHYLDLSSDVEQLATLSHRHQGAQTANSVLLPGLNPAIVGAQIIMDMVCNDLEQVQNLELAVAHRSPFNRFSSPNLSFTDKRFVEFSNATHQCQQSLYVDLPAVYRPQIQHKFKTWLLAEPGIKTFARIKQRWTKAKNTTEFSRELGVDDQALGPQGLQFWAVAQGNDGQRVEAVLSLANNAEFLAETLLALLTPLLHSPLTVAPGFYRASQLLGLEPLLRSANIDARFCYGVKQERTLQASA